MLSGVARRASFQSLHRPGALALDGLGARIRRLDLLPELIPATVVVDAAPYDHIPYATDHAGQPSLRPHDHPSASQAMGGIVAVLRGVRPRLDGRR